MTQHPRMPRPIDMQRAARLLLAKLDRDQLAGNEVMAETAADRFGASGLIAALLVACLEVAPANAPAQLRDTLLHYAGQDGQDTGQDEA